MKPRKALSVALVVLSSLLGFLFAEGVARVVWKKDFKWENYLRVDLDLLRGSFPAVHDAELGWIPTPNYSGSVRNLGDRITLGENGFRKTSDKPPSKARPVVLAVGDSFTFGAQVSDLEAWPAVVSQLLDVPVINAGVFGYGFDQTWLRARQLVPRLKPDVLVVSLIDDDIGRTELSRRTLASKPYFDVVGGKLLLKNRPVPAPSGVRRWTADFLGYSLLLHKLFMSSPWKAHWLQEGDFVRVHDKGREVCCLLMRELSAFAKEIGLRTIVLAQNELGDPNPLECLDAAHVESLDMVPFFTELENTDPARLKTFFYGHMTIPGNAFVAEKLADKLRAGPPWSQAQLSP